MKRGTEDLDFFIGDEALAAAAGPGISTRKLDVNNILIFSQAMEFTTQLDTGKLRIG